MAAPINPLGSAFDQWVPKAGTNRQEAGGFEAELARALDQVNRLQVEAEKAATDLVTGRSTDLSQAMIASTKASLGLELTVQVRNKLIEAYQEIMRMQV